MQKDKLITEDLQNGIMSYIQHLQADYDNRAYANGKRYYFSMGRKYVHIIMEDNQRSSHSWVMLQDDKKFKRGDILKSATWHAPARNFARGNVLCGGFKHIKWPGV
jgi:hypothetical protein